MKTLRSFRNIAALFILAMALLSLCAGVGAAHAASGRSCGYKKGKTCYIDSNSQCRESACNKTLGCLNSGCI